MRISDWSSDVCSSDLTRDPEPSGSATGLGGLAAALHLVPLRHHLRLARLEGGGGAGVDHGALLLPELAEIGRASCRERVCQSVLISVVAVPLKTQIPTQYNHIRQYQ